MKPKQKKDIEILIKVPRGWLSENELDFLTMLGRGLRGKIADRVTEGAVEKILEQIDLPKIIVTKEEIKSRMLDILAERALENKNE